MRIATTRCFIQQQSLFIRQLSDFPKYSPYVSKHEMNKIHKSKGGSITAITEIINEPDAQVTGIKKFLGRVYGCTGLSIAATLGIAQGMSYYGTALEYPIHCFGGGIVMAFGGLAGIMFSKYRVLQDDQGLRSENQPARLLSYGALVTGMSLTLSPMVEMCNEMSPTILPIATGLSLFTMAGASLFAYTRPTDSLLVWKAPLMGGLFGLVGVSFSALIGGWIFGFDNAIIPLLHNVDLYGGIVLFTGLTAYDTHVAIDMYKRKDPDHLGISVDMYLDFMNLLIRIMEVVAKSKQ